MGQSWPVCDHLGYDSGILHIKSLVLFKAIFIAILYDSLCLWIVNVLKLHVKQTDIISTVNINAVKLKLLIQT